jgi:AcrR family transcriptional regulator
VRHEVDTRGRLVDAFARQLAVYGYAGVSLEVVAREAGIRKPSLYHHFPGGKDELYAVVADRFIEERHALLVGALSAPGGLRDRLVAVVRALSDPTGAALSFDQRLFDALPLVAEGIRDRVSEAYVGKLLGPVEGLFREAISSGALAGDDPGFLTNAFLHLARATDLGVDDAGLPVRLVDLFLDGAVRVGG